MNYRIALVFLVFASVIFARNDLWIGCRYSVAVSFNCTDLGKKNAPKPKTIPMPLYPADEMNGELKAEVVVDFTVRIDGTVSEIHVVSASGDDFRDASLSAVRSWTFNPAIDLQTGMPASARMRCAVQFTSVEKEKPNQPPEPTTTAVTPRADARVAPAAVVAHL